ncbi:Spo0E family sporulation regulatory protein-aspartic acid phosphatase [Bacillus thuringiensis]|uniref:Spo0E family sporulation regulatory protein-aspartic acid phosphatase n=1 Tax=Bacillus thuringiensis TaxID=1428 RepID=UPI003BFA776C
MEQLQEIIEYKKLELVQLVEQYGLTHYNVLQLSRNIDELICQLMYRRQIENAIICASYRLILYNGIV